jgi:hydrogenase maturation protease
MNNADAAGAEPGVLVVGLGQRDRGDDAAGPAIAARVGELGLPGVRVIEQADPAGLLDAWAGGRLVVVADAVRSGRPPGTVHILHAAHGPPPAWAGLAGTHAFGLAEAVELARALGRLPPELVIVGIEAEHFRFGEPMSPPVAGALDTAARAVATITRTPPA